jgi:endonuclease G, mitochondrial
MIYRRLKLRAFLVLSIVATIPAASGCERVREQIAEKNEAEKPQPSASPHQSVHLFFGNPSNANESDPDNYLIVGDGSVISYNNSRGTPNWVSWRTVKNDLGPSLKRPEFRPDPRLPFWFARIDYSDYSGSRYDRGHMVPSADRFGDEVLNEETFFMTNIVPQTPALNRHPWEKLESYARGRARHRFDVYQIAGSYGMKERLKSRVAVSTNCWKIVIVMPQGGTDIDERIRVIAVDMPNIDDIEQDAWERYTTSIRVIEEKTGYDFFSFMPRETQDGIERRSR